MYMQGMKVDFDELFPEFPECIQDEERYIADYNYFKHMYPGKFKLVAAMIEDYIDRYEYEGSPIYMESPDQVTIYRMAEDIFCQFSFEGSDTELARYREMIQIMVCQEMFIRRRRRERYLRRFYRV